MSEPPDAPEDQAQTTQARAAEVCKAAMLGDQAAMLQHIDGFPELVNHADEQGHFPLHWAALNNRVGEVELLLARGAKVRAVNPEGTTALHWAVFRNALPCVETLLRAGAEKDAKDSNGYMPTHIAAQWGHTAALFHLVLRWGASFDSRDKDGRTPLHWAAYKGFHDCVRLLLVLGCSPHDVDIEGCNALHWAALRGNSEAATIVLQSGGLNLLTAADRLGSTPEQCANKSGHRMLAHYLHNQERKLKTLAAPTSRIARVFHKLYFAPVIWVATLAAIVAFHLKVVTSGPSLPPAQPWMMRLSLVSLLCSTWGLILMAVLNVSDPGYVPRRGDAKQQGGGGKGDAERTALKALSDVENLDCPALWNGRWEQLCVTCKIVRPLRAKHEEFSGRCIEVFDHFCPWVGNSIGKGNRHIFLLFVCAMSIAIGLGYVVTLGRLNQLGFFSWGPRSTPAVHITGPVVWLMVWPICCIPLLFTLLGLAGSQLAQAWQNITTNEIMNWHRYKHFRAPAEPGQVGDYRNPFDRGVVRNFRELCFPAGVRMMPTHLETPDMEDVRSRLQDIHVA